MSEDNFSNDEEFIEEDVFDLDVLDEYAGIFVVGDTHFRSKHLDEAEEFITRCVNKADEYAPDIIILLGDILDTHEVARCQAYNLAITFIEKLSKIAPTYVLIGNHDYINNSQYCTNNHFFNALKKWNNVTIVDRPIQITRDKYIYTLAPYIPPGRFIEALNEFINKSTNTQSTNTQSTMWQDSTLIFAHQEFRGVCYRKNPLTQELIDPSDKGDVWMKDYPPVISGHIHHSQIINDNILYPGSAMQIHFDESPDKKMWLINFDEEGTLDISEIDLEMKTHMELTFEVNKLDEFDEAVLDDYYIKLRLLGTTDQFKVFRKSTKYNHLAKLGVKFAFEPSAQNLNARLEKMGVIHLEGRDTTSFVGVLKDLIATKNDNIKNAYNEISNELGI